jgi:hypothetical protein
MGDKEGTRKKNPQVSSKDDKPKKGPTVDLELPDEDLDKAAGGAHGGGRGGWGVTNGCGH